MDMDHMLEEFYTAISTEVGPLVEMIEDARAMEDERNGVTKKKLTLEEEIADFINEFCVVEPSGSLRKDDFRERLMWFTGRDTLTMKMILKIHEAGFDEIKSGAGDRLSYYIGVRWMTKDEKKDWTPPEEIATKNKKKEVPVPHTIRDELEPLPYEEELIQLLRTWWSKAKKNTIMSREKVALAAAEAVLREMS